RPPETIRAPGGPGCVRGFSEGRSPPSRGRRRRGWTAARRAATLIGAAESRMWRWTCAAHSSARRWGWCLPPVAGPATSRARAGDAPVGAVPPSYVVVSMDGGELRIERPTVLTEYRPEQRTKAVDVGGGKLMNVTYTVNVAVPRLVTARIDATGAQVFGTDGK